MNASDYEDFSTDEMIKRVALLLRHELLASGCTLRVENHVEEEVWIHGDINNQMCIRDRAGGDPLRRGAVPRGAAKRTAENDRSQDTESVWAF